MYIHVYIYLNHTSSSKEVCYK